MSSLLYDANDDNDDDVDGADADDDVAGDADDADVDAEKYGEVAKTVELARL